MPKRYEVEIVPQYVSKTRITPAYKIRDNAIDSIICTCNTSEEAQLIVKAMNKTYKESLLNKRGVDITL